MINWSQGRSRIGPKRTEIRASTKSENPRKGNARGVPRDAAAVPRVVGVLFGVHALEARRAVLRPEDARGEQTHRQGQHRLGARVARVARVAAEYALRERRVLEEEAGAAGLDGRRRRARRGERRRRARVALAARERVRGAADVVDVADRLRAEDGLGLLEVDGDEVQDDVGRVARDPRAVGEEPQALEPGHGAGRRALVDDAARREEIDPVEHGPDRRARLVDRAADAEARDARQIRQELHDVERRRRVEARGRLVGEPERTPRRGAGREGRKKTHGQKQQSRLRDEPRGEAQAAPLAAAEAADREAAGQDAADEDVGDVAHADLAEEPRAPRVDVRVADGLGQPQARDEAEALERGHVGEEDVVLGHVRRHGPDARLGELAALDEDRALARRARAQSARQQVQQRRLARAARAHEREELAARHGPLRAVDRDRLAEADAQVRPLEERGPVLLLAHGERRRPRERVPPQRRHRRAAVALLLRTLEAQQRLRQRHLPVRHAS